MASRPRLLPLLLIALLAAACASAIRPAELAANLPEGAVRVTRRDNVVYVLRDAQVVGDSLIGQAGEPPSRVALAVAEIRRVQGLDAQGNVTGPSQNAGLGILMVGVGFVLMAAVLLTAGGWSLS